MRKIQKRVSGWLADATMTHFAIIMLGIAASYGVYSFSKLYVPTFFAVASAGAFELTYIGLANHAANDAEARRKAQAVALGAVLVSVLYNSIAGLLHRNTHALEQLGELSWEAQAIAEVLLAVLHGAPLALVAYFATSLVMHGASSSAAATEQELAAVVAALEEELAYAQGALVDSEQEARALQAELAAAEQASNELLAEQQHAHTLLAAPPVEKQYACECGRTFSSPQGLGGHTRACTLVAT